MKPARSCERITFLSRVSVASMVARSIVSSLVISDVTSSTRRSTGTGLKKCRPMTCSGRLVTVASFMIGIEEVLDANTARSESTTLSSNRNVSILARSSSVIASMMRSRSPSAPRFVSYRICASAASESSCESFPRRTAVASEPSIRPRPFSAAGASTSTTVTSKPARGTDLRDAGPHQAGSDHADVFEPVCHGRDASYLSGAEGAMARRASEQGSGSGASSLEPTLSSRGRMASTRSRAPRIRRSSSSTISTARESRSSRRSTSTTPRSSSAMIPSSSEAASL